MDRLRREASTPAIHGLVAGSRSLPVGGTPPIKDRVSRSRMSCSISSRICCDRGGAAFRGGIGFIDAVAFSRAARASLASPSRWWAIASRRAQVTMPLMDTHCGTTMDTHCRQRRPAQYAVRGVDDRLTSAGKRIADLGGVVSTVEPRPRRSLSSPRACPGVGRDPRAVPALVELEQLKPATADGTADYAPRPPALDHPDRVGEYRIIRLVARGGMGAVYEGVQESLGRHVALKLVPAEALADPRRLERFRREAKSAARLHHTNIVPVFGVGEVDGRHFYAMQFIDGHPLDAVIDEVRRLKDRSAVRIARAVSEVAVSLMTGHFAAPAAEGSSTNADWPGESKGEPDAAADSGAALSVSLTDGGRHYWTTVARLGEQAADALAYAHAQGILHRNIEPSKLLLDLRGNVWVTDFGLAKSSDADNLTQQGDVIRTLRYLAPERFEGAGDRRADIYAMGLTLYELLTLRPAFRAEKRAKLVEEVIGAEPDRLRTINPAIPRDLVTILLKAIDRDPAVRYQSATGLGDDLRRYVEDRPIRARRATIAEQVVRWCRRNPAVGASIAAVMLAILIGAGVASIYAVRAEHERVRQSPGSGRRTPPEVRPRPRRSSPIGRGRQPATRPRRHGSGWYDSTSWAAASIAIAAKPRRSSSGSTGPGSGITTTWPPTLPTGRGLPERSKSYRRCSAPASTARTFETPSSRRTESGS